MEYKYRLTNRECFSFVIAYRWKSFGIMKGILRLIGLWFVLIMLVTEIRQSMMGWWIILCTVVCVVILPIYFLYRDYRVVKKKMTAYDINLRIDDRQMVLSGTGQMGIPLSDISKKWENRQLLILRQEVSWTQETYIVLPQRMFSSSEEKQQFLDALAKNPIGQSEAVEEVPMIKVSFYMNTKGCAHMLAGLANLGENEQTNKNEGWKKILFWMAAFLFVWCFWGTLQAVIVGVCLALALHATGTNSKNTSGQMNRTRPMAGLGRHEIQIYPEQIMVVQQGKKVYRGWQGLTYLVHLGDQYFLCYSDRTCMCCIPQCAFASESDEAKFVDYCQERGLQIERQETNLGDLPPEEYLTEYVPILPDPEKKRKAAIRSWVIVGIVIVALIGFYAFVFSGMDEFAYEEDIWAEDYTYEPEEYPDYISLEQQVEILETLDIRVPERTIKEMKHRIEESRQGQIYVESYPFHEILCSLAYPEYDMETWEFIRFSDEAYWFDWESYDIAADYMNILKAVETMSQGELVIEDIAVNDEKVDWEEGSGTISIHFTCNGQPYEISVTMRHDWLNDYFIRDLNTILKQVGVEKRVYYFHDNGQGAVLFYRDKKWTKEFERLTDISLRSR